jgi:hypothetical protein
MSGRLVEEDGTHVFQTCSQDDVTDASDLECFGHAVGDPRLDADGDPVPEWAERNSWPFVVSHGWHIAEAAVDALESAETYHAEPLTVDVEVFYLPIHNIAYNLMAESGVFDMGLEDAITDPVLCPDGGGLSVGCLASRTFRIQVGPVGLITAPGEILPELAWGLPTGDASWTAEVSDPAARGAGARYFPQHDPDCNTLSYDDCSGQLSVGDCDCLSVHAWPYTISYDPTVPPLLDLLDTQYKAALSMVDSYLSYIIPEPDFNHQVSLLSDEDGDHYEDTVCPSPLFATYWQEAQIRLAERAASQ